MTGSLCVLLCACMLSGGGELCQGGSPAAQCERFARPIRPGCKLEVLKPADDWSDAGASPTLEEEET